MPQTHLAAPKDLVMAATRNAALTQPQTRDRILHEAERLFRAYGYAKTTVIDIARACAMSPANIYRFFESKAAINEAITDVILRRQEKMARSIASEARPASYRLKKLIIEMHRFAREQYLKDSRVHDMVRKAMDEQWSVINEHIERMRLVYATVIHDGMQAGEFPAASIEAHGSCIFNAVLPFCHPQLVAERFAADGGRQATMMSEFLVAALRKRIQ